MMIARLFLFWCSLFVASAQTPPPEEDLGIEGSVVVDLTPDDLTHFIREATTEGGKALLVNFHAPWCGHCKGLAPSYSEAATELQTSVIFAKVDCVEHKDECEARGISFYPALYFFHPHSGEKGEEYPGKTDGVMIRNWVQMHFEEPWQQLDTQESVDKFVEQGLQQTQLTLLGSFKDVNLEKKFKVFLSQLYLNSKPGKFRFGLVPAEIGGENVVTLRTWFDAGSFTTSFSKDVDLNVWIKNHELPLLGEMIPKQFDLYKEKKTPLVLLFVPKTSPHYSSVIEEVKKLAEEYRGKFIFGSIDADVHTNLVQRFGLSSSRLPTVVISNLEKKKHYPLQGEYSLEALKKHCQDYLQQKAVALTRTQTKLSAERERQEAKIEGGSAIKDVFTSTWDAIVKDTTKHVLVFFDAPWCKECRLLREKYHKIAAHFSNRTDTIIATIDVSENEGDFIVPDVLPGLTFFPSDNKAGLPYVGARDMEDLKFFVTQKIEDVEKKRNSNNKASEDTKPKQQEKQQDIEFSEHDEF